jgi:hypothetical protein
MKNTKVFSLKSLFGLAKMINDFGTFQQYIAKSFNINSTDSGCNAFLDCEITNPLSEKYRTNQQNRAVREYWILLSNDLNEAGATFTSHLGIDCKFNPKLIETIWREHQILLFGHESTTKLTTEKINDLYDAFNLYFSENFGVYTPFPSIQGYLNKKDAEKYG